MIPFTFVPELVRLADYCWVRFELDATRTLHVGATTLWVPRRPPIHGIVYEDGRTALACTASHALKLERPFINTLHAASFKTAWWRDAPKCPVCLLFCEHVHAVFHAPSDQKGAIHAAHLERRATARARSHHSTRST